MNTKRYNEFGDINSNLSMQSNADEKPEEELTESGEPMSDYHKVIKGLSEKELVKANNAFHDKAKDMEIGFLYDNYDGVATFMSADGLKYKDSDGAIKMIPFRVDPEVNKERLEFIGTYSVNSNLIWHINERGGLMMSYNNKRNIEMLKDAKYTESGFSANMPYEFSILDKEKQNELSEITDAGKKIASEEVSEEAPEPAKRGATIF